MFRGCAPQGRDVSEFLGVFCHDDACGGNTDFFFTLFAVIEKCAKDQADFSLPTFFLIKKLAKNQADGKCNRTGPYAPTVGEAPARSVFFILIPMIFLTTCPVASATLLVWANIIDTAL